MQFSHISLLPMLRKPQLFMFHQKCFSGTNQNKQNQTSLLLAAALPKGSRTLSDTASVSDAIEGIQPLNALPLTFFYAAVFDKLIQVR